MTKKEMILEITERVLKFKNSPVGVTQIYKIAVDEMGLKDEIHYKIGGLTPWNSIFATIYIDIRDNENSIFELVSEKPKAIKLKSQNFRNLFEIQNNKSKFTPFCERDIHPLLVYFVRNSDKFDAFCKTIFHEESLKSKKGMEKWLYPDIVGVNFEYKNYEDDLIKFGSKFGLNRPILYSFELKKELVVGNFREYYFQAVSNSSWANYGYLVALDIDESNSDLMELVKKLNASFGIGVMSLNTEELEQSKIIALAKFRENLDLTVMDELSSKNRNFKDFINTINDFDHRNEKRFKSEFDALFDSEEITKYMKNKKIIKE